jgi:hypothetical protein
MTRHDTAYTLVHADTSVTSVTPPHADTSVTPPLGRWSNKLSNKRFVGKQFVVKHIRTKHADKLEEVRSKVGGGGHVSGPSSARCTHPVACGKRDAAGVSTSQCLQS